MTTTHTESYNANGLNIATGTAPWKAKSLDNNLELVRREREAAETLRIAKAAHDQARKALWTAFLNHELDDRQDMFAENCFDFKELGIRYTIQERVTWPISGCSKSLQDLYQKEKDDNIAEPSVSRFFKASALKD